RYRFVERNDGIASDGFSDLGHGYSPTPTCLFQPYRWSPSTGPEVCRSGQRHPVTRRIPRASEFAIVISILLVGVYSFPRGGEGFMPSTGDADCRRGGGQWRTGRA